MTFALFEHIPLSHPFGEQISRFREMVNTNRELQALLAEHDVEEPLVHAEVKALPKPDGGFLFDRFYWSAQVKILGRAPGLAAVTLTAAPGKGQLDWLTFPRDPYLTRAQERFSREEGRSVEVLRYVPLRRLTFVETEHNGQKRIGKFKRRSRYSEAYSILGDVARAAERADVAFSVSQPLGLDDDNALYFQSCLRGEPVPELMCETNGAGLMSDIGRIHAGIHGLEPWATLASLTNAGLLERAERDLALIGFYVEDLGEALAPHGALLRRTCPGEELKAVCHGDFVASQLLRDGGAYSVIDFDLVTLADPYHDLSIFLASLDYDVPWIETRGDGPWKERFGADYLAGYSEQRGKPIDQRRLAWHRVAAEIYYLALMLKKDRYEMARARRRAACIRVLAEDLK